MIKYALPLIAVMSASPLAAATAIMTAGDDDCFGLLAAPCGDGETAIPATGSGFYFDNSGPSDPAGTDVYGQNGSVSFTFALDANVILNATAASFTFKVFGLDLVDNSNGGFGGDSFAGTRILHNSVDVGLYQPTTALVGFPPAEVDIVTIALDIAGLSASNSFTIIPEEVFEQFGVVEDFAIDYATFSVTYNDVIPPVPNVPLPASSLLLLSGLGAVMAMRRRKSSRSANHHSNIRRVS